MLAHPKHWPSWLLLGLIYALGRLPFPVLWALGSLAGRLGYLLARERREVARRNLAICLADRTPAERERVLRAHFGWLGVAALSQGVGWGISRARLQRLVRIEGRERIDDAVAEGRATIVLVPHFVGLELGGAAFTALVHPGVYMYQKIRNPVVDWQVRRARRQYGSRSIERHDDLRGLIRALREGIPFFYLPDQDGGRNGVFVPFCGVSASTVPMLGRFAAMSDAQVIPTFARYLPWGRGLELRFASPLEDFPTGDREADTAHMNRAIEAEVRAMPEQYFWVHRRFKTRPPGEAPIYPPKRRRKRKRR
ncbi:MULTISPECIES: lysophospholipid acyltransferase family protein [Marichromatium]|uniref:KDO2-lipid IV(A) lauroyltransferase n=1 Tax=Marichromatium gracile TaxID=1048 RepID=A0A4R4AEN8_MARGR|nr:MULTISPECIES: lipid A biosynthesis acyltransferase [Marichromatium]MBK1709210.1 lipid A biosynthesis acyltransferase [Marichromatium gracile]RNE90335.1 lipid A biosynthesis acyltransferase [Marichromatium sp. AB32]RNE90533.1 lipid A biosynthesis acyltransferase [Marichromatium sp. AB31]TCW37106.1 KDO2-lipid IV(A) lauroyltransferase [Marichromatium gracile]